MTACFYVYIMASKSRVLYIGITNNLRRRVWEHKSGLCSGFTRDYKIHRLVYFERFQYVRNAIHREKQLKGWLRKRKVGLIEAVNPTWEDLAAEWFKPTEEQQVLRAQTTRPQDDNSQMDTLTIDV
jgi:putative endonuclease